MKLFERTGGHWLFYISATYLLIGMWSVYNRVDFIWLSPLYILFLSMPFWFPPLGRAINLSVDWDCKMFDWFKNRGKGKYTTWDDVPPPETNVVKFPELKAAPESAPEPEKPATVFYRFGVTDKNRLAFQMGYSEITMSKQGVQDLIDQLEFFKAQLKEEADD